MLGGGEEEARLSTAGNGGSGGGVLTARHSGNGALTGGGVRKIYGKRMSLSELAAKAERRVGLVVFLCLAVNVTVFIMYLLMHSWVHSTLVEDIQIVRRELERQTIENEAAQFSTNMPARRRREADEEYTTISTSTTTTTSVERENDEPETSKSATSTEPSTTITETTIEMTTTKTSSTSTASLFSTPTTSIFLSTTTESTIPATSTFTPTSTLSTTPIENLEEKKSTTVQTITTTELDEGKNENDKDYDRRFTVDELDEYVHILHTTYNMLATFALLNAALLTAAVVCLYFNYVRSYVKRSPAVQIALKAFVLIALIFLFVELTYLVHPLLYYSWQLRDAVDALFASDASPQSREFMRVIQERFVCTFPFESLKTEYTAVCQDDCVAKLKDHLLRTYAVLILIIMALIPFVVIGGTWLWHVYAKDRPAVRRVRDRLSDTAAGRRIWRELGESSEPAASPANNSER